MSEKEKTVEVKETKPVGFIDKLAYCAGDFGCNMSWALKSYLTIYWTQYMGVDSYVLSALLLAVQVWDAIDDPLIGGYIDSDRRKYKRNKFLQYIYIGSFGLLVGGALCFLPFPNAPAIAKNVLFVAGYVIWDAFYTVVNVPYGSMLSVITDDPTARVELSSWRSIGSMAGNLLAGVVVPMVIYDSDSNLLGERMFPLAIIMGLVGFCCFQFAVRNTTIRVDTEVSATEEKPKFNYFKAVGNFLRNRPAVGATIASFASYLGLMAASTASAVMFQSYFNASQISGIISSITYVPVFIYPFFVDKLMARFGKKELCTMGSIIMCIGYGLMVVLPIQNTSTGLAIYVVCNIIGACGSGLITSVVWSLMADATDYSEWKFGVREEGTTYSLYSFFNSLGMSIGPSLGLVVATWLGYDETLGAAQTAATALNMRYLTAVCYLVMAVIELIGYGLVFNLDKKTVATMHDELNERHAAQAAEASGSAE